MNFSVGEKVVCIKNHSLGYVIAGQEYIVDGVQTCVCGQEDVKIITGRAYPGGVSNCHCGHLYSDNDWYNSKLFRRKLYNSAHDEIIEKYPLTEEVPDTPIKEPQI